jgi:hypothetical protein
MRKKYPEIRTGDDGIIIMRKSPGRNRNPAPQKSGAAAIIEIL